MNSDPQVPVVYFGREDGDELSGDPSEIFLHVSPLEGSELKFSIEPHVGGLPEPPWTGLYGAALKRDQIEHLHRQIGAWLQMTARIDQPARPRTFWRWQQGR